MSASKRRIAVMLELNWPLKRHVAVFEGTQRYAVEHGHWACTIDEFVDDTLSRIGKRPAPYDGVIARATPKLARLAREMKIPVVNVWMNSPVKDLPSVFPDFEAAGQMAAEHLLARGFRRFATIVRKDISEQCEARTMAGIVREAGFPCEELSLRSLHMHTLQGWRSVQRDIQQWMQRLAPPVAVLAGAEELGRIVAQQCQLRGLRIPLDVAIIAGTNDDILCEHPPPKLSSIEFGYDRVGYEAARLLDALMKRRSPRPARGKPLLLPPTGIVSRESTDFFAVEDVDVAAALRYIGEHCDEPIDVNDVADAVHVSRPTLERRFRRYLGRPIAAEIRRLRLERAKRQLMDSDEPLKVIARQVGFANEATMNAVFRRELGLSPGEYRATAALRPLPIATAE